MPAARSIVAQNDVVLNDFCGFSALFVRPDMRGEFQLGAPVESDE
jgi:hypothetical protein